jgi:hypothetical protein
MLTYTIQPAAPLGGSTALSGLVGREGVVQLQKALRSLAYKKQDSQYDPQKYDGTMDLGTIVALLNATKVVGDAIPYAGKAISVIGELKDLLGKIPYGGKIIDFVMAPQVVDEVFDAVMAILGAFHLGDAASTIKSGVNTAKDAVATAAAPAALAIALVVKTMPTPSGGLGAVRTTLRDPKLGLVLYDPRVHGPLLGPLCTEPKGECYGRPLSAVAPTALRTTVTVGPTSLPATTVPAGMVAAPAGCTTRFISAKGPTSCPPGQRLITDPARTRCTAADGNMCIMQETAPAGMVAAPTDCGRLWIWAKGPTSCPPGQQLVNDPARARCTAADGVVCVEAAPGTVVQCPTGQYWNPTTKRCAAKATVTAYTTPAYTTPCPNKASSLTKRGLDNIRDAQGNCFDPEKRCPAGFAATIYGCARFSADYKVLSPPTKDGVVHPHIHEYFLDVDVDLAGFGPPAHWNPDDSKLWEKKKGQWKSVYKPPLSWSKWNVKDGELPFRTFAYDNKPYGVFYNGKSLSVRHWDPKGLGEFLADTLEEVGEFIEEYGCAIVNNGIVVSIVATGAGLVASPAAAGAVVAGASAGAAACAAVKIGEALYLIIKLLAFPIKTPKDLGQEAPPPDLPVELPTTSAPAASTAKMAAGTIMGRKPTGIQTAPGTSQALLPIPTTLPPAEIQPPPITATLRPAAVFQWFDPSRNAWRIAAPRSLTLGRLDQPPQQYDVTEANKSEPNVEIVSKEEGEKRTGTAPWYKTNKIWILVGAVSVTAAGAATYFIVRRRRRTTKGLKDAHSTALRARRMRRRLPR